MHAPNPNSLVFWAVYAVYLSISVGCIDPVDSVTRQGQTDACLERGIEYLMSQQSADGLWRSPNYGNLKGGAAMSAFVLYSFQDHSFNDKDKLQTAVEKLLPGIERTGYVTNEDGPDYTNYGSAMLLVACEKLKLDISVEAKQRLVDYLVRSQLDDEEGFRPKDVDFGGWDLSGWMTGSRPSSGTNISVTASVVEALIGFREQSPVSVALENVAPWIRRVQNGQDDGGFHFHPEIGHDGNKAGWPDGNRLESTRSYGSATADGLQILALLGKDENDESIKAAINWLETHNELKTVPGFAHESGEQSWAFGLRFYYYQSLSRCLELFPNGHANQIATNLIEILEAEQNQDGSWTNRNARMREDDPLIATGFAIIALRNCQRFLEEEEEEEEEANHE